MANTRDYGKFQGRRNFAEGGSANPSVSALKQMLADTGIDQPTKKAAENRQSGGSQNYKPGPDWESNVGHFDEHGMPMHRMLHTPMGDIPSPFAKGGLVKKKGKSK